MEKTDLSKVKIGISSCLLGEEVRFDGGHKKNSYITGVLTQHFTFVPFCPEVEAGLGTPREPIRLILENDEVKCVGVKTPEWDVTELLEAVAKPKRDWQRDLCGYILKKDSPSCGMERVKVYSKGAPNRSGVGLYAQGLIKNYPHLPIEEEGRLEDPHLRENFIQRVYVYSRWKKMQQQGCSLNALQDFHACHKYIFMSHNQQKARELGVLMANHDGLSLDVLAQRYLSAMMSLLKTISTRKNHVNTLQHIQGYLKTHLDNDDKAELSEAIDDYRQGLLPLIVPITLLRHHFRKHPNEYIEHSFYMEPHPGEMMLLNHI
jgi:uncharacterized protein YbgA (DUF1722 family)/uncharacterized protein YbbK (DUF523 family)